MDLQENKYITKKMAVPLAADHWTMERLATARIRSLTVYKGIGSATAQNIIVEARRLINEYKYNEAALHAPPEPEESPAVSVRVKRIKDLNA